jgi:hypothetical protein
METRKHHKLVHEGKYVAEVEVELVNAEKGWSPYISLDDALKLDEVREALRAGDIGRAKKLAKVYKLSPVAA